VLKMVQTDSLINSTELGSWIRNLPEGYLDTARSFMGSNANLMQACKKLKLDIFIQTESLSRGCWTPVSMDLVDADKSSTRLERKADGKVCADVLESLLGLVFLQFDYRAALECADALQLTIPHRYAEARLAFESKRKVGTSSSRLVEVAEAFTGYKPFRLASVAEEALTHPTELSNKSNCASYEKLEWIGDAVLCRMSF